MRRWLVLVHACLLVATATAAALETKDATPGRQIRDINPRNIVQEAPEYEIVIARFGENSTTLAWLAELPSFYQVTIINKVHPS
jgi:hypothetical protein